MRSFQLLSTPLSMIPPPCRWWLVAVPSAGHHHQAEAGLEFFAEAQNLQFPQLMQAGIWLDGVRHGMDHRGDKPVMESRPYQTETGSVGYATDLTVAT